MGKFPHMETIDDIACKKKKKQGELSIPGLEQMKSEEGTLPSGI